MPLVFSESRLTRPTVPAAWTPVIDALADFRARCRREAAGAVPSAELRAAHDALVEASADLLEPAAVADVTQSDLDRLFARSVFQLARLRQAAVGDAGDDDFVILDTIGCRTLGMFEADFFRDPSTLLALKDRLRRVTSLSAAELWDVEREVERDFDDARRKNAVVAALRERYALEADSPMLSRDVYRLFLDLYPGAPLREGEVDLVLTPTLLLLVLPFEKKRLDSPRWDDLGEPERAELTAFWDHVNSVSLSLFSHFPAFSNLDLGRIDAKLVAFVSQRAGLGESAVRQEIGRMVTVLPRGKLDAYVVHDVWGHAGQASLLRFDDIYQQVATFSRPLGLDESAEGVLLGDVLAGGFDAERFRWFCGALVAERLPACLTAVFAEMMADAAEYKLMALHPQSRDAIPNTSLFRALPTKLDFILRDLGLIYPKATEALDGYDGGEEAAAVWRELRSFAFAADLAWRPAAAEGAVEVPLFTLCALHFLGVHRATVRAYAEAETLDPASAALPLKSYRDLLILAASAFFEADPRRNLWRLDEFLSLQLLPLLRRFQEG